MILDCDNNLIHWQIEFFGRALDNADVGLMGNDPVNVLRAKTRLAQRGGWR